MTQLKKFYFMFYPDHDLKEFHQLIYAPNEVAAMKAMFKKHGMEWLFPLNEEKWGERINSGMYRWSRPLEPITVGGEPDEQAN